MTAFGAGYRIDPMAVKDRDRVWMTGQRMSDLIKENVAIEIKDEYKEYVQVEFKSPETIKTGYDVPANARGPIDTAVVRWRCDQ